MKSVLKKIFFTFIYIVSALAVSLVLLEISANVLHLGPELPEKSKVFIQKDHLSYHYKPQTIARMRTPEFDVTYRYNKDGLRDHDRPLEKPENTFRILGLGDSFTEGVGAQYDEMYLTLLEGGLNQSIGGKTFDVIKAGVAGYDPKSERKYLEHYGYKYNPDLVLVAYSGTDAQEAARGVHYTVSKEGFLLSDAGYSLGPWMVELYLKSRVARTLLTKYLHVTRSKYNPSNMTQEQYAAFRAKGWSLLFEEYSKMKEICDRIGAQMVVMYIPFRINGGDLEIDRQKKLGEWCRANQVPFVDLLPAFQNHPDPGSLHYQVDLHCTPLGNRLIAFVLFQFLTKNSLV